MVSTVNYERYGLMKALLIVFNFFVLSYQIPLMRKRNVLLYSSRNPIEWYRTFSHLTSERKSRTIPFHPSCFRFGFGKGHPKGWMAKRGCRFVLRIWLRSYQYYDLRDKRKAYSCILDHLLQHCLRLEFLWVQADPWILRWWPRARHLKRAEQASRESGEGSDPDRGCRNIHSGYQITGRKTINYFELYQNGASYGQAIRPEVFWRSTERLWMIK